MMEEHQLLSRGHQGMDHESCRFPVSSQGEGCTLGQTQIERLAVWSVQPKRVGSMQHHGDVVKPLLHGADFPHNHIPHSP